MSTEAIVDGQDIWKKFRLYQDKHQTLKEAVIRRRRGHYQDFWALRGVNLTVPRGQSLGLIGQNGSGKSTLLKLVAGILTPNRGQLRVQGRIATLLELGAGFQQEYTGVENIFLNGAILGLNRRQITERLPAIVAFAELDQFIDNPVRSYSSGMYMRLGFAIAVHLDPDLILIDEVLAVGDEAFQRKCIDRIRRFKREGRTMIFVSHDLGAVAEVCDRVLWIEHGQVRIDAKPKDAVDGYLSHLASRSGVHDDGASPDGRPVRVHAVRFRDSGDRVGYEFETGSPLKVEVDYEFLEPIRGPFFGVSIFRNDGVYCYGINTKMDSLAMDGAVRRGTITLDLPELPLLAGSYEISLGFFDLVERPLFFQHREYRLRVRGERLAEGVVTMGHRWTLS